jgi:hypothetical protein
VMRNGELFANMLQIHNDLYPFARSQAL